MAQNYEENDWLLMVVSGCKKPDGYPGEWPASFQEGAGTALGWSLRGHLKGAGMEAEAVMKRAQVASESAASKDEKAFATAAALYLGAAVN